MNRSTRSIMGLVDLLTGNRMVRNLADSALVALARRRTRHLDQLDCAEVQEKTLLKLVRKARNTKFGKEHGFEQIRSVSDYQKRVPLRDYEAFWEGYWKAAYPRIENLTWPGWVPYYALSSGTTSGATKYIPVSKEMLKSNKKAAMVTLSLFRSHHPEATLFNGRFFFLGGNTNMQVLENGSRAGDLSAIAAREVTNFIRPYTFPSLEISSIPRWEEKLEALARASVNLPITALSGVPSWMLRVFDQLKKITGKSTISEIWPHLRLIVHGGTKFDPFREVFQREIGSDRVKCVEVYPCSEGFVATEDPRYQLLRIVPDHYIFFEFVPVEELGSPNPRRHTLRDVEIGIEYAVVMTTCAGLWSYLVGDTVSFEKKEPPLIRFTGRTKYFLSAFGEHLISEEAERGVAEACSKTGALFQDFHVGPVFPSDPKQPGWHRYLIEFRSPPRDVQEFAKILDTFLCKINEDYDAHRQNDLTMGLPEIQIVKPGGCDAWMLAHGKTPPQHKFPRMDNSGKMTESIRGWMATNGWLSVS
jgi:hypothetical protein